MRAAHGAEELMMISATGIIIRTPLDTISLQGRAAQGVTLMNLKPGDKVAAVALLNGDDEGDNGGDEATAADTKAKQPAGGKAGAKGKRPEPKGKQ